MRHATRTDETRGNVSRGAAAGAGRRRPPPSRVRSSRAVRTARRSTTQRRIDDACTPYARPLERAITRQHPAAREEISLSRWRAARCQAVAQQKHSYYPYFRFSSRLARPTDPVVQLETRDCGEIASDPAPAASFPGAGFCRAMPSFVARPLRTLPQHAIQHNM